ncbi:MAG: helix-turn-helix domain-containing protein [Acidobacteriota bacterium]
MTDYVYRQKEVAEFLGVHYSTISRWVSKTSNARIKT